MRARQILGGRYRLERHLGSGGMSLVWRARDELLGRDVAVKVLAQPYATDPAFDDVVRAEAMAAASISHPHVTSVFDFGICSGPAGDDSDDSGATERAPYVVMELLEGRSLSDRLGDGPLPPELALRVCAQVAGALSAAHARGVVHRDVKPGNVILTPTGAKVFDFGLAASVGQEEPPRPDRVIFGTPAYLAPERLAGAVIGPASDLYALGLLLYRLLTDDLPWPADTVTEMVHAHTYVEPGPLPDLLGVPDTVADLYRRCLSKEPTDRPTAHEAAVVLAAAAGIPAPVGETPGEEPEAATTPAPRLDRDATPVPPMFLVPAAAHLAFDPYAPPDPYPPDAHPPDAHPPDAHRTPAPATGPPAAGGQPMAGPLLAERLGSQPPLPKRRPQSAPPNGRPDDPDTDGAPGGDIAGAGVDTPVKRPNRDRNQPWVLVAVAGGALAVILILLLVAATFWGDTRNTSAPGALATRGGPVGTVPVPGSHPADSPPGATRTPGASGSPLPGVPVPPHPTATPPTATGPRGGTTGPATTTLRSVAGTVVARCSGEDAVLTSWASADGFQVQNVKPGPAPTAKVKFKGNKKSMVVMSVTCDGGTPVLSVKTS